MLFQDTHGCLNTYTYSKHTLSHTYPKIKINLKNIKYFVEKFCKRKIWPEIVSLGLSSCLSVTWLEVLFCASDLETEYPCLPSKSLLNIWDNLEGYYSEQPCFCSRLSNMWGSVRTMGSYRRCICWLDDIRRYKSLFTSACAFITLVGKWKEITIYCCWFANLLKLSIL